MAEQLKLFDLPELVAGAKLTFKTLPHPVWTENKAKLIARYLRYFVFITKHGAYIDGFAGPQEPGRPEMWAARLVLESEPRWLRSFYLCERNRTKVRQLERLKQDQPEDKKRSVDIYLGDFNEIVSEILQQPGLGQRVAAFCLLDQRTFECAWGTVEKIAKHKPKNKIELFYFLGTGWLDRALSGVKNKSTKSTIERWWGKPDWDRLRALQTYERSDLFCKRFREEFGYKYAFAWPITDKGSVGRVMYHMIHASDHDEAPKLMARAYRRATGAPEPMEQLRFEFEQLLRRSSAT